MTRILFLPGAGGRRSFWQPVVSRLAPGTDALLFGWPGFGNEPPHPNIRSLSDLAGYVLDRVEGDFNLVAQSMGGAVALQIALWAPERLRGLVLCGTSGGVDFGGIEREDWRPAYMDELPEQAPRWFVDDRTDLTARLGEVRVPALLIWGGEDPIAPPAAGRMLAGLLPNARLVVIPHAGHNVALTHPEEVAEHIGAFLSAGTLTPSLSFEGEGAVSRGVRRAVQLDKPGKSEGASGAKLVPEHATWPVRRGDLRASPAPDPPSARLQHPGGAKPRRRR